jgi:hypothetical protein
MDHEHILALVEAVHGAHGDAIHGFAANAAFVDHESTSLEQPTLAKNGCTVHSTIRASFSVVAHRCMLAANDGRFLPPEAEVGRPGQLMTGCKFAPIFLTDRWGAGTLRACAWRGKIEAYRRPDG